MRQEITFTFPLESGLHARPATALRERALIHDAQCEFSNGRSGRKAFLGNLLSLLGTETRQGDPCAIRATGPEAENALADLEAYLSGAFLTCDDPTNTDLEAGPQGLGTVVPTLLARAGGPWWQGIAVAPGTGLGRAVFANEHREAPKAGPAGDPAAETRLLDLALGRLRTTLRAEADHPRGNATQRAVLEAHLAMLQDQDWLGAMATAVAQGGCSAASAAHSTAQAAALALRQAQIPKLRERALDLEDLGDRLVRELTGKALADAGLTLTGPTILLAPDLTPSRFLALDRTLLKGLVLAQGGGTSHTAILARSFGIPCVTGISVPSSLGPDQTLLVDGDRALVIPDPGEDLLAYYRVETQAREARTHAAAGATAPPMTADGHPITLRANILTSREAAIASEAGAQGIGLFRTEILFLDRAAPPTENSQFEAYREALVAAQGQPVVLRLLDVGGDKPLSYLPLPLETNPYLGCRGVRWYASQAELIITQLRAALRAAPEGDLRLLVPMVSELEELRAVKALVAKAEASLDAQGLPYKGGVPLGIMVEVPAAALNLDALAREADFFCVGSNDLVQYLFAADRGDPKVAREEHSCTPPPCACWRTSWVPPTAPGGP